MQLIATMATQETWAKQALSDILRLFPRLLHPIPPPSEDLQMPMPHLKLHCSLERTSYVPIPESVLTLHTASRLGNLASPTALLATTHLDRSHGSHFLPICCNLHHEPQP